jgi:hypothetical protein
MNGLRGRGRRYSDLGRVPVGALIAVTVLVAAGIAAYVFLKDFGALPTPTVTVTPSPTPSVVTPSDDSWLDQAGQELLPPVSFDEREPPSNTMQDWVWDYVDDTWQLEVFSVGEGDGGAYLADLQTIFLVSPDDERFRLWELRVDYVISLVHWDAEQQTAWLRRGGRPGMEPVIQMDIRSGEVEELWGDSTVASSNTPNGGVANVDYLGTLPNGDELWSSFTDSYGATGLFFRTSDGSFDFSLVTDEIRRLKLQGFADDGVQAWVDVAGARVLFHGNYLDLQSGAVLDQKWFLYDAQANNYTYVTPDVPITADCRPASDRPDQGRWEGDAVVAVCDGQSVLIDPLG